MKRLGCLLAACLCLAAWTAAALEVPRLTGRVVDTAGVFAGADAGRVDGAIRTLEAATGGQMAVLTVPTLGDTPIEEFGIAVMDQWQIGHKDRDDGAILIIAVDDRKMRLEIGYGWEGEINDARAGDIIRAMAPYFRENRYADGTIHAVSEVQRFVTGEGQADLPPPAVESGKSERSGIWFAVIFVIVLIFMLSRGRSTGGRGGGGWGFGGGRGGWGGGGGGGFSGGGGRGGGGGASGGW